MLILLISFILLFIIGAIFEAKEKKFFSYTAYVICVIIALFTMISDPMNLDRGVLKFTTDDLEESRSIERVYSYIDDMIGGIATKENIVSKLEELNITVQGDVKIDDIDETSNGYTVKFNDDAATHATDWILHFYKNENNDVLKNMKKGDIISISHSEFNNLTFNEYESINTISFKNCEVQND